MKITKYFTVIMIMICSLSFAQIPNSNFEEWLDGEPINWFTSNILDVGNPVSKTTEGYISSSALRGEIIKSVYGDTIIPVIISGEYGSGFPVENKYDKLNLYYKFHPIGGDILVIGIWMYKSDDLIGGGSTVISESTDNFTLASVDIEYIIDLVPDNCIIEILAANEGEELYGNLNTYFIVDNLSFGNVTSVKGDNKNIPEAMRLDQNYPNPFNPSTMISFGLPESASTALRIFNSIGENVATLINEDLSAGNYSIEWNASEFPSGIYFYALESGNYKITKKMLLLK